MRSASESLLPKLTVKPSSGTPRDGWPMGYVAAYKENKSKRAHTAKKILDTDPLDCPVIFSALIRMVVRYGSSTINSQNLFMSFTTLSNVVH